MGKSYVISDIYGQNDMLVDVIKKIQLKDSFAILSGSNF